MRGVRSRGWFSLRPVGEKGLSAIDISKMNDNRQSMQRTIAIPCGRGYIDGRRAIGFQLLKVAITRIWIAVSAPVTTFMVLDRPRIRWSDHCCMGTAEPLGIIWAANMAPKNMQGERRSMAMGS